MIDVDDILPKRYVKYLVIADVLLTLAAFISFLLLGEIARHFIGDVPVGLNCLFLVTYALVLLLAAAISTFIVGVGYFVLRLIYLGFRSFGFFVKSANNKADSEKKEKPEN